MAAALDCALHGADILRVHDVREVAQALRYWGAVKQQRQAAGLGEATGTAAVEVGAVETGATETAGGQSCLRA